MNETSHAPLKRLMLYHHFDRDQIIDPHVLYQIRACRACGIDIVFLTNSDLPAAELQKLDGLVLETVLHGNHGFDFGAWRSWLLAHGPDALKSYDRFLLMNCSCYGPLFPLEEMLSAMEAKDCDFWGVTDYENDLFPAHVQSYFLCFKPQVFLSEAFWRYWKDDHGYETFELAIREGEVAFCTALTDAGFRWEPYCGLHDERTIWSLSYYPSYSFSIPDFLIAHYRIPLIKIKGFISENKYPLNKAGLIMRAIRDSGSGYPLQLIVDHQRRTEPVSWQRELPDTLLVSDSGETPEKPETALKLAVTAHAVRAEELEELPDWLRNIPYPFDLLLSVPSEELAADCRQRLRSCGARETVIRAVEPQENGGLAAWLTAFGDLRNKYDLVLRVAFPDSGDEPEFVRYGFRLHRRASLAASPRQTGDIVAAFEREPRLGLVFPSFPAVQMLRNPHVFANFDPERLRSLVARCGGSRIPPKDTGVPVFPAGGMFWYRPKALEGLFACGAGAGEFPRELWERAIPYVAQAHGFYYRLSISQDFLAGVFQLYEDKFMSTSYDENAVGIERLSGRIRSMEQSLSWKITKPLRMISSFLKTRLKH